MVSATALKQWEKSKPLIRKGYEVLGKEVTMGLPGTAFPAASPASDTGVGSPYGDGARKIAAFFSGIVDKILLNPTGETFPPDYSPYMSTLGYNPFFIPLADAPYLPPQILEDIYESSVKGSKVDFNSVAKNYTKALKAMYKNFLTDLNNNEAEAISIKNNIDLLKKSNPYVMNDALFYHSKEIDYYLFVEYIASSFIKSAPFPYIGDIQVRIPYTTYISHKEDFLSDFTLGAPPDVFSTEPQRWNFPVLNPEKMFTKGGKLGSAGKILYDVFAETFKRNKAGIRIDHYIGMVNPYVISVNPEYADGRLYSSPKHPLLKKYVKHSTAEFANITTDIILKSAKENHFDIDKIYIEDIGMRPPQLDKVIKMLGLGRMLVSQFVEPWNKNHIYRLKKAKPQDIAVIDTHDTPSIQEFFFGLDAHMRELHASQLTEDLRFNYAPDLKEPKNLVRMKWGELMASPAKRVQAFFTSLTGQSGRYNTPNGDNNWFLRIPDNFADLYLSNLKSGSAYNPFDAVCLGIYARGDAFFARNKKLVEDLRTAEQTLLKLL